MRLLLDASVGRRALAALCAAGHDAVRVGADDPDPGDEALLARAVREGRVLLTADKDFGELIFLRGLVSPGIVRLVDHPLLRQPAAILAALSTYSDALAQRARLVVEPARVRIRVPDAAPGSLPGRRQDA